MSTPRQPRLRLVVAERPLAKLSYAEKLAHAKAYLQRRGKYVLDRGTPKPNWGIPFDQQPRESRLAQIIKDADRRGTK